MRAKPSETITVIQGGAKGADNLFKQIAVINGWRQIEYAPNESDGYPQKFFIRNQRMADHQPTPNVCIAMISHCWKTACFPKDHMTHGTADMIRRAQKNGIPVVPFGEVALYVK